MRKESIENNVLIGFGTAITQFKTEALLFQHDCDSVNEMISEEDRLLDERMTEAASHLRQGTIAFGVLLIFLVTVFSNAEFSLPATLGRTL